jgi:hypothetical protein
LPEGQGRGSARRDVLTPRTKFRATGKHLQETLLPTVVGQALPLPNSVTRERAIQMYEAWIRRNPKLIAALPELAGKRLGCHCKPLACHGDVLIRLLDEFFPGLDLEESR